MATGRFREQFLESRLHPESLDRTPHGGRRAHAYAIETPRERQHKVACWTKARRPLQRTSRSSPKVSAGTNVMQSTTDDDQEEIQR